MTREEIIQAIDNRLTGVIDCDNAEDARLITDTLRDLGYRWQMLYEASGKQIAHITYMFDP